MGEVFKAWEPQLRRHVAIKKLSPRVQGQPDLLAHLREEAMIAASLRHPNIVVMHGTWNYGEEPYLCMELLAGRSFTALLADEGHLPAPRAMDLLRPVAHALVLAHGKHIEHHDLKPDNLFVD